MNDDWMNAENGQDPADRNADEPVHGEQETHSAAGDSDCTAEQTDAAADHSAGEEEAGQDQPSVPDGGDMTYSWVNPKLRQDRETADKADEQKALAPDWQTDRGSGAQNSCSEESTAEDERNPDPQEPRYASYQFEQEVQTDPEPSAQKKKPEKKSGGMAKKFGLTAALAFVFGIIAGLTMYGVNTLLSGNGDAGETVQIEETIPSGESSPEDNETAETAEADSADAQEALAEEADTDSTEDAETATSYTVAEVAANAMPSVVAISNISVQEVEDFFGGTQSYESESSGSGIIVGQNETELLVATNNHVVEGASTITVTFIDETSAEAQIKGTDTDSDLAVVAVELDSLTDDTVSQIKIATIGSSDDLVVGEQVVAIGNALGYGQSVTSGYVSALNREVTVDDLTAELIQTDAAINPGNSGGALLNMAGELIGINAVKFASSEVEGMGYAIPISTAEPILDDLMSRETRSKVSDEEASYLGITCRDVSEQTQEMYGIPVGVFVDSVSEGSAAEEAGMLKGDVITQFDGIEVSTSDELISTLEYYPAGETVTVIVMRAESGEYVEVELTVTLDAKPANTES